MEKLDAYKIDLKAMTGGAEARSVVADDTFFSVVEGPEIQHGNVAVNLTVRETAGAFTATIDFDGEVEVMCDRCLEPMMQQVAGKAALTIRLGETYEDDGEIIVVPEDEGVVDLSWQVYEQIALQIPLRHVHAESECASDMQEALFVHEAGQTNEADEQEEGETPTDPRWDALKKLITTNN